MVSSNFVCSYFNENDSKKEEYKKKLDELLGKPKQIIFIDIQYCSFSNSLLYLLSRVTNIIIFTGENYLRDMKLKEYQAMCRNLILNSRPKFALVVNKGNREYFTGPVDNSFLYMIEDTDLHNYINIVPQHCYHYNNTYKLDYQSITLGILNKYFKENVEESLVILTLKGENVFEQLEKKVSLVSSNFLCSYFNEDDFKNKEYKSKLDELLGKPEQIIFIDIQYCNFSFSLFDLLSRVKNIIVFSDENIRRYMNRKEYNWILKEYNWILKEYNNILKKYMLKCRNLILNSRPKFALVVHKGNFEFSTGPVDHPFINMIQDSNLHNYINIVPQHCYHYKNTYKLDYQSITLGILNKYFKENVEESLVILTLRGKTVFEQLEEKNFFGIK